MGYSENSFIHSYRAEALVRSIIYVYMFCYDAPFSVVRFAMRFSTVANDKTGKFVGTYTQHM